MSWEAWGDPPEYPCQVCEKHTDNCECPECQVCGNVGDPDCYTHHGLGVVTEEDAFWLSIMANTADQLPRLVFADWLQERGRDADGAALRATADRVPAVNPFGGPSVCWTSSNEVDTTSRVPFSLIRRMYAARDDEPDGRTWIEFPTAELAIRHLLVAWVAEQQPPNPKADFAMRREVV